MTHDDVIDAFIDAFDRASLERVLRTHFGLRLDNVAGGNNFEEVVSNLITRSEREGWLPNLILSAFTENSGNTKLKDLVLENHWRANGGYRNRVVIESSEGIELDSKQLLELIKSSARIEAKLVSFDDRWKQFERQSDERWRQFDERLRRVEADLRLRTPVGNGASRGHEYVFYVAFLVIIAVFTIVVYWTGTSPPGGAF